ncbi:hypothetical protein BDF14DRAFT_1751326 [Spinellus fusiger]|nr:hypothetical protein BDF14DRAFT_1751326 [Spinellus fusiger]
MVELVLAMFPNIPVPAIIADLQRTGAVETTVDNALRNGGLPLPPSPSPSSSPSPSPAPASPAAASSSTTARKPPTHTNLFKRYQLDTKAEPQEDSIEPPKVWENSVEKRQEMLRKRKEFMVLQARKRLAEMENGKNKEKASPVSTPPILSTTADTTADTTTKNESVFEEMSVEELNTLTPEKRRQHMLEAIERRKTGTQETL